MKKSLWFSIVGLLMLGAACQKTTQTNTAVTNVTNTVTNTQAVATNTGSTTQTFTFTTPKKSAHYESNAPAHGMVLAGVPTNVVIDFNFDLHAKSTISIIRGGREYGQGQTTVDGNKLTLRRTMDQAAPDGVYTVNYNACWPDGSCHDGNFQFALDRARVSSYLDQRGQATATIRLAGVQFSQREVRITKGTKVIWVNDDSVEHYINTDSHPAHTYEPGQNSRALAQGQSFSYTFTKPGVYSYHCSAHAATMTAAIVVE